jgi:hypothetical protein
LLPSIIPDRVAAALVCFPILYATAWGNWQNLGKKERNKEKKGGIGYLPRSLFSIKNSIINEIYRRIVNIMEE